MKCVRDIGIGIHWATWQKKGREYRKKFWKKNCPYTRRCRTCTKAYHSIDIKTRHDIEKRRTCFHHLRARIILSRRPKTKWQ